METAREKLLEKAYSDYLNLALYDFPIDRIGEIVAEDITGYGTTKDEKVLEIKRLRQMIIDQRLQGAGMEMQFKHTPVHQRINPSQDTAIYTDEFEISMIMDEGKNVIPLRLTSVFEFNDNTWKLVHIHGSAAVETEGDTWHLNEWQKKNEELQRLVDEKTAELVKQKNELEIEAALERVRTHAMAMQSSDDLASIVEIVFTELKRVGFQTIRSGIGIIESSESKKVNIWSTTLAGEDLSIQISGDETLEGHPLLDGILEHWAEQTEFSYVLEGKDLLEYYSTVEKTNFHLPEYAQKNSSNDAKQYYYMVPCKAGGIYAFSIVPFTDEVKKLLRRFIEVFQLAYTRYIDLKRAEAQAREAQIEAALEKVRSRSMGMQKSNELTEVIKLIYEQVVQLNIHVDHAGFVIDYEPKGDWHFWIADKQDIPSKITHPYFDSVWAHQFEDAKAKGLDYFATKLNFEEKNRFYRELFKHIPDMPEASKEFYFKCAGLACSTALFSNISLYIENFSGIPYSEEENKVLMRFGKVFQQTYTRFLDLQKAEEQAREAQIELSLERIRAQVTAMRESSELLDIVVTMNAEFRELGHEAHYFWHMRWLPDTYQKAMTSGDGSRIGMVMELPRGFHQDTRMLEWEENDEPIGIFTYDADAAIDYVDKMVRLGRFDLVDHNAPGPDDIRAIKGLTFVMARTTHGEIGYSLPGEVPNPPEEDLATLVRFAGVFDLAYRRFEDLKTAEIQNRETQIELALEKVRSKALAMHRSEDFLSTSIEVYHALHALGINTIRSGLSVVTNENKMEWEAWSVTRGHDDTIFPMSARFTSMVHEVSGTIFKHWKEQDPFFTIELKGEEVKSFVRGMPRDYVPMNQSTGGLPLDTDHIIFHYVTFPKGVVFAGVDHMLSEDEIIVLKRFTSVFAFAYTRYLDIQLAENQAREAQIQLALERVRARTMAMHHSDELGETSYLLFEQFKSLGKTSDQMSIGIFSEDDLHMDVYITLSGSKWKEPLRVRIADSEVIQKLHQAWEKNYKSLVIDLSGLELKAYNKFRNRVANADIQINEERWVIHAAFFSKGLIIFSAARPEADETVQLLERFTEVFNQTYIRFLDLKKAEEQAREAQIEAALEKVRGVALAMHSSEDLGTAINVFFKELKSLGHLPRRCGVAIINEEARTAYSMATTATTQGESFEITGEVRLDSHPILTNMLLNWKAQTDYFLVLDEEEAKEYYRVLRPQVAVTDFQDARLFGYYLSFKEGAFYVWTDKELSERDLKIFRRFTQVVGLTYRRYLDLLEAEKRTFEAVRQASLDRVRGQIASMRTSEDLQHITPLIWRELTTLEVPFFRCGVFIINEKEKNVHVYLSTPDGKALAVLHLAFDFSELTKTTVASWRKNMVYQEHWDREKFIAWTKEMMKIRQINAAEDYQGDSAPPESLHLHFIPFAQGMLYVGNTEQLDDEKIGLVKSLAEAFSYAYARYEDFVVLEEAKGRVEKALNDLKATQSQLIHAEKMASLGELTAGIAHEIQNPLNFVNNFSEVSVDLVDEMKQELEAGSWQSAGEIADDIRQNLDKINHHGKRASDIVRGMLQHSRNSSGEKSPTDLNALADEYLRLAYHGLRARDKSFNADFKLDAEENLPRVNVVPQDIGRVLLNLINNAFYAVNARRQHARTETQDLASLTPYKPLVTVTTKKLENAVEIRVQDNGDGIPEETREKIFQPFFTTKPTGEGTGLGLSMSYDIITNGHGGTLTVETKEGEGSRFFIKLKL